jgi:competence protein ComEA
VPVSIRPLTALKDAESGEITVKTRHAFIRAPHLRALVVVMAVSLPALTAAQAQLPDAPGKEETVRVCGTCHEPLRAASVRLTRDGWEDLISKMVSLGAKGSDEELQKALDYLAENFPGEAAKPLNMNSATSVELESVAAMLRKESAAWIAYRNKTGPCKTLDDLKRVPGIDFKKIDARRDRLVCF